MQDVARINNLISAAASRIGSDTELATAIGTSKTVISDWRHGRKSPSIAAQAELAEISGSDVGKVVLYALVEDADGARKVRLQRALRALHQHHPDAVTEPEWRKRCVSNPKKRAKPRPKRKTRRPQ